MAEFELYFVGKWVIYPDKLPFPDSSNPNSAHFRLKYQIPNKLKFSKGNLSLFHQIQLLQLLLEKQQA